MGVIWLFWKTTVQNYLERILVVASPKSPILTWSFESRKIFTGFRSRWIMPCWWMWARPSTISLNNRHTLWSSLNNPLSIAVLQQSKVPCYMMCHKQPPFTIIIGTVTEIKIHPDVHAHFSGRLFRYLVKITDQDGYHKWGFCGLFHSAQEHAEIAPSTVVQKGYCPVPFTLVNCLIITRHH